MPASALAIKAPAPTLGRRASFWVSAGVVAHTLWTSAAPAMTYPLYAKLWHLTPTTTTAIYSVYPIAVVAVLVGFGDVSDYIGRRAAMLWGLAASLIGVLLFALAPSVPWLFLGRVFMGVGVGLSAGPSAAAVVEFSPPGQSQRAGAVTAVSQSAGFAASLFVSGSLIQYAPLPTHLSFWVLAAVIAALFAVTWLLPRESTRLAAGRWQFKAPAIPASLRATFLIGATAVTTSYTHGTVFLALGAQVAHDLVGSSNVLVNAGALMVFAAVSGGLGLVAKKMPPRLAIVLGALFSTLAMALLALSVVYHGLGIFLMATASAGAGYSLLFLGGLAVINAAAPPEHRGGTLSALFLLAYLGQGVIAIGLGLIATAAGLKTAITLGAAVVAVFSAVSLGLGTVRRKS